MNVTIIGAGAIGRAIGHILRNKKNVQVSFWDQDPSKVHGQKPLHHVLTDVDVIFLCVPSFAVRTVAEAISKEPASNVPVISVAKGLEQSTKKTMDEVLVDILPSGYHAGMLCGPMLAGEIMDDKLAVAVLGSSSFAAFEKVQELFSGTNLKLVYNKDIHAVAVAGVLKNIYAIGVGVVEGLGYGHNAIGAFMGAALMEMEEIAMILGGDSAVVRSPAGVGDFIATAGSKNSRNHIAGKEIGKIGSTNISCEGLQSLPVLAELLGARLAQFPLLSALQKVILNGRVAKGIFEEFYS